MRKTMKTIDSLCRSAQKINLCSANLNESSFLPAYEHLFYPLPFVFPGQRSSPQHVQVLSCREYGIFDQPRASCDIPLALLTVVFPVCLVQSVSHQSALQCVTVYGHLLSLKVVVPQLGG